MLSREDDMAEVINVISADLDGAQLRREKVLNSYHARCDGREDTEQIQDAIDHVGTKVFSIPAKRWEAIFGGK